MPHEEHRRRQSRRSVLWRVFYGSESLVADGTLVDMSEMGCHIAGSRRSRYATEALHLGKVTVHRERRYPRDGTMQKG
jgi:hypothetical protein